MGFNSLGNISEELQQKRLNKKVRFLDLAVCYKLAKSHYKEWICRSKRYAPPERQMSLPVAGVYFSIWSGNLSIKGRVLI
jgi:hypothetical protein